MKNKKVSYSYDDINKMCEENSIIRYIIDERIKDIKRMFSFSNKMNKGFVIRKISYGN